MTTTYFEKHLKDTINASMFHFNFDDQTTIRLEGHNPACHSVGLN